MNNSDMRDLNYWYKHVGPRCPYCGVEFAKLNPAIIYEIYPHWTMECTDIKDPVRNHDGKQGSNNAAGVNSPAPVLQDPLAPSSPAPMRAVRGDSPILLSPRFDIFAFCTGMCVGVWIVLLLIFVWNWHKLGIF